MLFAFFIFCCFSASIASDSKGVSSSDGKSKSHTGVEIVYLNIRSQIQARFATTLITSKVNNPDDEAKEITFTAHLPDAAFMSNFSMFINDKIIYGEVKEKEEAKTAFEAAKSRGESAGHVAQKNRETNVFQISVNVAAHSKITFNLTYQEILKRIHGVYKQIINLQPDQPVGQITVEMNIIERGEITNIKVPKFGPKVGEKTNKELMMDEDEKSVDIRTNVTKNVSNVHVVYQPKQKDPNEIVAGQLVLLYDVKRDLSGGDIEVVDGFFVHFFAPEGLPKGNKHVVFILDKSGSMMGRKFEQLKDAMKVILNDLSQDDLFNIIFFSSELEQWKKESVKATPENVKAAQLFVMDTEATGGTNIYDSLNQGLKLLDASHTTALSSMLLFLTDGQPTVGVTNGTAINEDITKANVKRYIINGIAFGDDADFLLMRKISSNNRGLAKKVYEDSDATIQMTGFYDEISTPLLSELKIDYLNDTVDVNSLVQEDNHNYFNGGEVVVIGKIRNDTASPDANVLATVSGKGQRGSVELKAVSSPWICPRWGGGCCPRPFNRIVDGDIMIQVCCWGPDCHPRHVTTPRPEPLAANTLGGFIERMWAYQTIKKLLKQNELSDSTGAVQEKRKKEALELSLRYHFVTELTSMVVIQPNETATIKENKGSSASDEHEQVAHSGFAAGPFGGAGGGIGFASARGANRLRPASARGDFGAAGFVPAPAPHGPPTEPLELMGETGATSGSEQSTGEPEKPKTGNNNNNNNDKKEEKPKDNKSGPVPCHVNLMIVKRSNTNSSDQYNNLMTKVVKDLRANKNIETLRVYVLELGKSSHSNNYSTILENTPLLKWGNVSLPLITAGEKDNVSKIISAAFEQINDHNATNVVIFTSDSEPMKHAVDAAPSLVKQGTRIYCVSTTKIDDKKKSELLGIAGDFANLFVQPSSKVISDRLLCNSLYVWRANF